MKKLPIGIQSFEKLITENCLYIDKTKHIYQLITNGYCYFLSRPRRFGKSLLCSTLKALFEGKRELFKGLWIDSSNYKWEKHPVILLDLANIRHETPQDFKQRLLNKLIEIAESYNISYKSNMIPEELFGLIIKTLAQKNNVVLLIDEYDKPIIDHLHSQEIAQQMRDILRNFYATIKSLDEYLRFVLLTGVSKFSKTSVFSGINNLEDLTITQRSATLLGYTQEELTTCFNEHITFFAQQEKITKEEVIEKMKSWYDGYRFFHDANPLYNPFSVLLSLKNAAFDNYWFETGTPTFLINLVTKRDYQLQDLDGMWLSKGHLGSFEITSLPLETLLFQTGYLTIKDYNPDDQSYQIGYPNKEVTVSFFKHVALAAAQLKRSYVDSHFIKIARALRLNEIEKCLELIKEFLGLIPYTMRKNNEYYYHSMFYIILKFLGAELEAEIPTAEGRIDAMLQMDN